jgi:hypothetical protein
MAQIEMGQPGRDACAPTKPSQARYRQNQKNRLLQLLMNNRGRWVSLPRVMTVAGAKYSTRIWELRRSGVRIENKTVAVVNGQCRTAFRIPEPEAN